MKDTQQAIHNILNEIEKGLSPEDLISTEQVVALLKGENAGDDPGPNRIDALLGQLGENVEAVNQGYSVPYYREFHSSRPGIGKLITTFKKLVRKCLFYLIDPMAKDQEKFNSHATRAFNANTELIHILRMQQEQMGRLILRQEKELQKFSTRILEFENLIEKELDELSRRIDTFDDPINDLRGRIDYHERLVDGQREDYDSTLVHFYWAKTKAEELDVRTLQMYEDLNYHLDKNVTEIYRTLLRQEKKIKEGVLSDLHAVIRDSSVAAAEKPGKDTTAAEEPVRISAELEKAIQILQSPGYSPRVSLSDQLNGKITELSGKKPVNHPDIPALLTGDPNETVYTKINYFDFENSFRGSLVSIRERQMRYLPYFQGKSNVLDLGCGRGEFLELLRENHIPASGVELFPEVVDFCKLKDLSVEEGDGVEYLATLKDGSLDGIFAGQVIEHLTTDELLLLCHRSFQKLSTGGTLIFETPNPTTLAIYVNFFYADPSHVKPVHPFTLKYFLGMAGFSSIEVIYTEESRDKRKIIPLQGEGITNLDEFNHSLETLSNLVYGCQDYAVIAKK